MTHACPTCLARVRVTLRLRLRVRLRVGCMPHVPASASCAPMLCHVPSRVRARVMVIVRGRVRVGVGA